MRKILAGVLFVALAGAVIAWCQPKPDLLPEETKKHHRASRNNLRQIGLAFQSYSETHNRELPRNIEDKNGRALLSWRVAILPFVKEEPLYKEFKLDEPWDSENNKKLIEKMPKLYAPVRVTAKAGETFYQVFYGEKALFGPKQQPKFPASLQDGTSNTVLVVEAGDPVIWTKPADLPFDEKKPLPKLGGLFDDTINVGLCDGSVLTIWKDFDEQEMKYLIMPADGHAMNYEKLKVLPRGFPAAHQQ
jgi:hypothetical protein